LLKKKGLLYKLSISFSDHINSASSEPVFFISILLKGSQEIKRIPMENMIKYFIT
jgi:hypothetical protein